MTTLSGMAPRRRAQTHSRRKHHRWCVDGNQVRAYALESDLNPDVLWWEHLDVRQRVLQIEVFRNRSAFTAVICEGLARVEPGLEMVRDLGPNLVFALLMDGALIKARWPGVYATALADDPGSSVLTLTSMGLIQRSNEEWRTGDPLSRSIAFWKSRTRKGTSLSMPVGEVELDNGSQAAILALESDPASETTMDGRPNSDTSAWSCDTRPIQVALDPETIHLEEWDWITEGPAV